MTRRLAFFSPIPPVASGVSDYLLDLLPLLPESWEIEVFRDTGLEPGVSLLGGAGAVFYPPGLAPPSSRVSL